MATLSHTYPLTLLTRMNAATFTIIFLLLYALNLGLKFWLDARQMRHVRGHRDQVPAQFAEKISLQAHQKAAAYTIARTRLGIADELVSAVLAMVLGVVLNKRRYYIPAWIYRRL